MGTKKEKVTVDQTVVRKPGSSNGKHAGTTGEFF
jgi:hypothetical protein